MHVHPLTIRRAIAFVAEHHRRLPRARGLWSVGLSRDAELVGCAVVGFPSRTQTIPELAHLRVLRLAVIMDVPNGCSMLYGAAWRAARGMGARRMDTHTHLDEPGTSLRSAGWFFGGFTSGGEWARTSRPRAGAVDAAPKLRWWAPGSILPSGERMTRKARS